MKVLTMNDRGQITIPKKIREKLKTEHFGYMIHDGKLMLIPIKIDPVNITED